MISTMITDESGRLKVLPEPVPGCWVSVTSPSQPEKEQLSEKLHILPEFIEASLDPEEASRIDSDPDKKQTLLILDYPESCKEEGSFNTEPLGILLTENYFITISRSEPAFLTEMESGKMTGINTAQKTRLLLKILLKISEQFQADLTRIEHNSDQTTKQLFEKMRNRELLHMLELDKSLVYFSTSLRADDMTIRKILRTGQIRMYPEDQELLEDVLTEFKQAEEMCEIYTNINSRTMEGFSNVINNNMNITMKELTIITIVMSIPNMIYGFYGMNVEGLAIPAAWFPLTLSVAGCILAWWYFKKTKKF